MRTMLYMSRIAGLIFLLMAAFFGAIILVDIVRFGPHGRGYMLGVDLWHQMRSTLAVFF